MIIIKEGLFENIQKRARKAVNGNRRSVKLEKVSSIRSTICALEVFKQERRPFSLKKNFFNKLTDKMQTETSISQFKTFCKNVNFEFQHVVFLMYISIFSCNLCMI